MLEDQQNNAREPNVNRSASDKQSQERSPGTAENISHSRRRIAKASLLAPPILMSVVSRPVLGGAGVNCFSNALSGNLSHPDRGLCQTPAIVDWSDGNNWPTGLVYMGVPIEPDTEVVDNTPPEACDDCKSGVSWDPEKCSGGTAFNAVFPSGPATSMYQNLCESGTSDEAAAVEMLLYALTDPTYALRPMQVQDLYAGKDGIYAPFLSHFGGTLGGYLLHTLSP